VTAERERRRGVAGEREGAGGEAKTRPHDRHVHERAGHKRSERAGAVLDGEIGRERRRCEPREPRQQRQEQQSDDAEQREPVRVADRIGAGAEIRAVHAARAKHEVPARDRRRSSRDAPGDPPGRDAAARDDDGGRRREIERVALRLDERARR
jgi:hypothetical protein